MATESQRFDIQISASEIESLKDKLQQTERTLEKQVQALKSTEADIRPKERENDVLLKEKLEIVES